MRAGITQLLFASCVAMVSNAAAWADEAAPLPQTPKPYPRGITCVSLPLSDSYSLIDDKHVVFEVTLRRAYLVTLARRCLDLDTSLAVRLDRTGTQLCTGDLIITDSDRCSISYIEDVIGYKEAKAIVDGRNAAEKPAQGN